MFWFESSGLWDNHCSQHLSVSQKYLYLNQIELLFTGGSKVWKHLVTCTKSIYVAERNMLSSTRSFFFFLMNCRSDISRIIPNILKTYPRTEGKHKRRNSICFWGRWWRGLIKVELLFTYVTDIWQMQYSKRYSRPHVLVLY